MKKKIQVQEIEDKNTNVPVNTPEHTINEIKRELSEFSTEDQQLCKAEVVELWDE